MIWHRRCICMWWVPLTNFGISGGLPFWTVSLDIASEPPRTKYSGEPDLYPFLARTKAWLEIIGRSGRRSYSMKKILPEHTVTYSPERNFSPHINLCIPACLEIMVKRWYCATPSAYFNMDGLPFRTVSLDIASEPLRTKYSGEPDLYPFLARTRTCLEIIGRSRHISNLSQWKRAGRTVIQIYLLIVSVPLTGHRGWILRTGILQTLHIKDKG